MSDQDLYLTPDEAIKTLRRLRGKGYCYHLWVTQLALEPSGDMGYRLSNTVNVSLETACEFIRSTYRSKVVAEKDLRVQVTIRTRTIFIGRG